MAGEVHIPDEARRAMGSEYYYDATTQAAIEAAAPFIDRAARIDELNFVLESFKELTRYELEMTVQARIAELEQS
jgi:hypothetical protein